MYIKLSYKRRNLLELIQLLSQKRTDQGCDIRSRPSSVVHRAIITAFIRHHRIADLQHSAGFSWQELVTMVPLKHVLWTTSSNTFQSGSFLLIDHNFRRRAYCYKSSWRDWKVIKYVDLLCMYITLGFCMVYIDSITFCTDSCMYVYSNSYCM